MMADDRQNPEQQHSSQFHMQQQQVQYWFILVDFRQFSFQFS